MAMHEQSLSAIITARALAPAGQKVVFVSGNFNVIHPGHLRILKFARECGDYLVVGVQDKTYDGAVLDEELRLESVRAVSMVDHAFLLHDKPEDFITALQPAIVIKGNEHENAYNPEKAAVEACGGKLLFCSGDAIFSSLDMLKNDFTHTVKTSIIKPTDFLKRHGFTQSDLRKVVQRISGTRVLVIGDLIVDEYIECDPLGMSQEDPTLVVAPVLSQQYIGGAGIVAGHTSGLGCKTNFLTVGNEDATQNFAKEKLGEYGVEVHILHDGSRPTTLKQRYRASGKTLLRVSHLKQHWIEKGLQDRLLKAVDSMIGQCDLVILSDFNYGCLPQPVIDTITSICVEAKIPFTADSQSSSQVGDICRFKDAMLIKPTEREARLALRDFQSGLITIIDKLQTQSRAQNIAITLGAEGVVARNGQKASSGFIDDRLPAFNLAPKDTAGAGDSFLVLTSLALTIGADLWQSMYLGSLAAACQVSRLGNIPLTSAALLAELGD